MVGLVESIVGFAKSGAKVAATGFDLVDDTRYKDRLAICGQCEYSLASNGHTHCKLCGCNMALKAKFSASNCPIDADW
jgi:hypothetical protein